MITNTSTRTNGPDPALDQIDHEHETQLRLLNELEDAIRSERDREEIEVILKQLIEFTDEHFMSEQILMRLAAYPGYQAHVDEHDKLMDGVKKLVEGLDRKDNALTENQIAGLRNWLTVHMNTTDSALAKFMTRHPEGNGQG